MSLKLSVNPPTVMNTLSLTSNESLSKVNDNTLATTGVSLIVLGNVIDEALGNENPVPTLMQNTRVAVIKNFFIMFLDKQNKDFSEYF